MKENDETAKNLSGHDKNSFIKILSVLTSVDGELDSEEEEFLESIAAEWGITEAEMKKIHGSSQNDDITVPKDETERIDQLAALVGMMMVDGKIFDEEFQFCSMIAEKFGFKKGIVNDIIADLLEGS